MSEQTKVEQLLGEILKMLRVVVANTAPESPRFSRPLNAFRGFNWSSIGAKVKGTDNFGVSHVERGGHDWQRRSGVGRFGDAIWFSRNIGKDSEGRVKYAKLIEFKDKEPAEPVPDKLLEMQKSKNGSKPASSSNGSSSSSGGIAKPKKGPQGGSDGGAAIDEATALLFNEERNKRKENATAEAVAADGGYHYTNGQHVDTNNEAEVSAYQEYVKHYHKNPNSRKELRAMVKLISRVEA